MDGTGGNHSTGAGKAAAPHPPGLQAAGHDSLKDRAVHELKAFIYITLYFWVLFLTFDIYRWTAFQAHNISIEGQGFAIVNALILAKVTLVVETLLARRKLRDAPMIFAVLGHALLLALVLVAFHVVEDVVRAMWHGAAFLESLELDRAHLARLASMGAIFFVATIPFCAFQEFVRLIGHEALLKAIFAPRAGVTFRLVAEQQAGPADRR